MIQINIGSDIESVIGDLARRYPRQVQIAQQRAVVGTAKVVRQDVVNEMKGVFNNPTRWTLNAFRIALGNERMQNGQMRPVAGGEITAAVQIKDGYWYRADNYLQTQINGGERRSKAFERALQRVGVLPQGWLAVPGDRAKMDAHGNHSVGEIRQILSWFDAAELVAGSRQNMRDAGRERRRRGTRRRAGFEYLAIQPGNRRGRLLPGIYRKTFHGLGVQIEPIMIFIRRASYKPRFKFEQVARASVRREFKPRLERALAAELERMRT